MMASCTRLVVRDLKKWKFTQLYKNSLDASFSARKTTLGCICHVNRFSSVEPKKNTFVSSKSPYYPHHELAVVGIMQQFGFEEDETKLLLANQPELMNIPSNLWNDILECFYNFGFDKEDIVTVLEKFPKVLFLKKEVLNSNLRAWSNCNFQHDFLCQILTTHPTFLQVHYVTVSKRVKQYQVHFESKNRAGKLLLLAPNTLEESWPILLDKINYLDNLCTEKKDIVASGVLAHSGFHIKVRHEFLIRAGLYKRPQKDFCKRLSKNPKLATIVNTTDEQFVSNSGLSMFEYEVFLEMYKEELAEEEVTLDSDDEASDDDDQ